MKFCLSCQHSYESPAWTCPDCGYNPEILDGRPFFAPELAQDNSAFPGDTVSELFELEASNFWFRSRNELLIWALKRYFPTAGKFLEIGCGTGFVLHGIQSRTNNLKLYGAEMHSQGLQHASERISGATLLQMDARKIPFRDEFDVIGAFDVLEHIEEDKAVLAQMRAAVRKPGGGILLTVPQHKFLWSAIDEYSKHVRRYEASELITKVEEAGFEVLRITSFISILLPLMLLSRATRRGPAEECDPRSEFRIPGVLNKTLEVLLSVERAGIKLGASYPCGGSLLLVARAI